MTKKPVYIGSSFSLKERVGKLYNRLVDEGYYVPDVWWNEAKEQANLKNINESDREWYDNPRVVARAERHFACIKNCEIFIIVCPEDGTKKYNGAAVELGYAHAHGLDLYSWGRLERSAMYVPVKQTNDIDSLISSINMVGEEVL